MSGLSVCQRADLQVATILTWTIDKDSLTLLHYASIGGHTEVVKLLVEHGADVNTIDTDYDTALHYASTHGRKDVVKVLVQHGIHGNAMNKTNQTTLHMASINGHTEVVKLLVEHGADLNAMDEGNRTALHDASLEGHTAVVKILVEHGADVNAMDVGNRTALPITAMLITKNVHITTGVGPHTIRADILQINDPLAEASTMPTDEAPPLEHEDGRPATSDDLLVLFWGNEENQRMNPASSHPGTFNLAAHECACQL
ncbi:ankyrin repeat-containing domain protein [Mycena leptocephala]|nr:ankyrin repeat-containing domain protein [Mycena leptocephala]